MPPADSTLPGPGLSDPVPTGPAADLTSGTLLAGRYRIVAPLGKGGMGEVYRADDLTLGTTVALKFLPSALAADPLRLERFRAEVRLARQVAHPNACRVFDIAEVDGRVFLAMEYIDGEDLSSLLRRIGRLPREKAVETARQVCFGLAAVHDAGLIHRDLKPANIMMDGRGRARLTDFGLASHGDLSGRAALAGTPLYMAPEQMAGVAADKQSDIYALGLVLFELFTGRHAHGLNQTATWADLQRAHLSSTPASTPSAIVQDIDPAAERIILRCLERDPARRPRSVMAVAAALPGGDALQAALAAGEMPSPELVAQAGGGAGLLSLRSTLILVALFIASVLATAAVVQRHSLIRIAPSELSAQVLTQKAREMLTTLGYSVKGGHSASGFVADWAAITRAGEYRADLSRADRQRFARELTAQASPAGLIFWYRWSALPLEPRVMGAGRVAPVEPPMLWTGECLIRLDTRGRLVALEGLPPSAVPAPAPNLPDTPAPNTPAPAPPTTPPTADWSRLLALAGLEEGALSPAAPLRTPWHAADTRLAWTGRWRGSAEPGDEPNGPPVRVEAASERGKVVHFGMYGPWSTPGRTVSASQADDFNFRRVFEGLFILAIFATILTLAWFNHRRKRGDPRGAWRLAAVVALLTWIGRVLVAPSEGAMLSPSLQVGASLAAAAWSGLLYLLVYLALEPFIRRDAPEQIITWVRLLDGRVRDRRLCGDVLLGGAMGALVTSAISIVPSLFELAGAGAAGITTNGLDVLDGPRFALGYVASTVATGARFAMLSALLLMLAHMALRVRWASFIGGVLLVAALLSLDSGVGIDALITNTLLAAGTAAFLVTRGLVAALAATLCSRILFGVPLALDPGAWYLATSIAGLGPILAIMGWAAWHAVRGRTAAD
ncbi:MAG: serine/threonine-protein kinase [Phycisphaerales bacterium]